MKASKKQIVGGVSIFDKNLLKEINLRARQSVAEVSEAAKDKQVRSSLNVKSRNGYLFMTNTSENEKVKVQPPERSYCRFKYFESLPQYDLGKPCIGGGSPDKASQEERENRKKWVSKKDFQSFVGGKQN